MPRASLQRLRDAGHDSRRICRSGSFSANNPARYSDARVVFLDAADDLAFFVGAQHAAAVSDRSSQATTPSSS